MARGIVTRPGFMSGVLVTVALALLSATAVAGSTSESISLFVRPEVAGAEAVTLYGALASGKGGAEIAVEAKDCGTTTYRAFAEAVTRAGGGWSTTASVRITTTLRAVHGELESTPVTVRKRANVQLDRKRRGGGFWVGAGGLRSFWHKRVRIERRQGSSWKTVKSVLLTDSDAASGYGSWTEAEFTLSVPKGTEIRAVLPQSQTGPCYLPGVSRVVKA
jgi:hypothetical protein